MLMMEIKKLTPLIASAKIYNIFTIVSVAMHMTFFCFQYFSCFFAKDYI